MRDVTVLWALRSPCSLACRYCYFGTPAEHRADPPTGAGQLSHLSRDDVPLETIMAFMTTAPDSAIQRVFLAGGEPLNWLPALDIARALKEAGIEVVICTNGIPLNKPRSSRGSPGWASTRSRYRWTPRTPATTTGTGRLSTGGTAGRR